MTKTQWEVACRVNYTLTKAPDHVIKAMKKETGGVNFADYKGKYRDQITQKRGHNIVPLAIRSSYASVVSWTAVTPTFEANYIAIGSDFTPETELDTKLGAEFDRALFTDRRSEDNVAFLDKFFGSPEVGWTTVQEIWIFVDGTATVDTWFLLSRITINETFTALESLTINATITFA